MGFRAKKIKRNYHIVRKKGENENMKDKAIIHTISVKSVWYRNLKGHCLDVERLPTPLGSPYTHYRPLVTSHNAKMIPEEYMDLFMFGQLRIDSRNLHILEEEYVTNKEIASILLDNQ